MAVVEMTARVVEVIGKEISACLLLDRLRDEFIKNQIAVAQDTDRHEAGRVRVVGGHLSQIEVVDQQQAKEEKDRLA